VQGAQDYVFSFKCQDRPGIIAAVSSSLFQAGCDIRDAAQYGDPDTGMFFVRIHFTAPDPLGRGPLEQALGRLVAEFELDFKLHNLGEKLRTLIAVSKQDHCLNDLLHRWRSGLLHTEIVGVISNHEDLGSLTQWYGLPFYHLPLSAATKAEQEAQIVSLMQAQRVDLLVLARYMQILSQDLCRQLEGRCINIHHSFLPSFKGAKPYHRAHEHGVKLVGATAHFVTTDLDEGPIIEQDVVRVNHGHSAQDMVNMGREVEARVLARAVRWYVEHRIQINGQKTIVFE
jgi:formyltetrahydrofolate deformylase